MVYPRCSKLMFVKNDHLATILDLSREQIEQWSQQLGFDYVTDPTNHDTAL